MTRAENRDVEICRDDRIDEPVVDALTVGPGGEQLKRSTRYRPGYCLRPTAVDLPRRDDCTLVAANACNACGLLALTMQCAQVPKPFRQACRQRLKQHLNHAATALTHRRTQRKTPEQSRVLPAQEIDGNARAFMLKLSAADRSDTLLRRDNHFCADFARCRTTNTGDRYKDHRFIRCRQI